MITGADVLSMLIPTGGWVIAGDAYENIEFIQAEPITKAEYEAGFVAYPAWKAAKDAEQAAAKADGEATLIALGLTPEQLAALGL